MQSNTRTHKSFRKATFAQSANQSANQSVAKSGNQSGKQTHKQKFVLNQLDFPSLPKSATVEKSQWPEKKEPEPVFVDDVDEEMEFFGNPLNDEDAYLAALGTGFREFNENARVKAREQTEWEKYEAAMSYF